MPKQYDQQSQNQFVNWVQGDWNPISSKEQVLKQFDGSSVEQRAALVTCYHMSHNLTVGIEATRRAEIAAFQTKTKEFFPDIAAASEFLSELEKKQKPEEIQTAIKALVDAAQKGGQAHPEATKTLQALVELIPNNAEDTLKADIKRAVDTIKADYQPPRGAPLSPQVATALDNLGAKAQPSPAQAASVGVAALSQSQANVGALSAEEQRRQDVALWQKAMKGVHFSLPIINDKKNNQALVLQNITEPQASEDAKKAKAKELLAAIERLNMAQPAEFNIVSARAVVQTFDSIEKERQQEKAKAVPPPPPPRQVQQSATSTPAATFPQSQSRPVVVNEQLQTTLALKLWQEVIKGINFPPTNSQEDLDKIRTAILSNISQQNPLADEAFKQQKVIEFLDTIDHLKSKPPSQVPGFDGVLLAPLIVQAFPAEETARKATIAAQKVQVSAVVEPLQNAPVRTQHDAEIIQKLQDVAVKLKNPGEDSSVVPNTEALLGSVDGSDKSKLAQSQGKLLQNLDAFIAVAHEMTSEERANLVTYAGAICESFPTMATDVNNKMVTGLKRADHVSNYSQDFDKASDKAVFIQQVLDTTSDKLSEEDKKAVLKGIGERIQAMPENQNKTVLIDSINALQGTEQYTPFKDVLGAIVTAANTPAQSQSANLSEESVDSVTFVGRDGRGRSTSVTGRDNDLDEITAKIREEIVDKQNNIIKQWLIAQKRFEETASELEDEKRKKFQVFCNEPTNKQYIDAAMTANKDQLEAVVASGYKTVHSSFPDRFKPVGWENGAAGTNTRTKAVMHDGKKLCDLTETMHKLPNPVTVQSSKGPVNITGYRNINFPTEAEKTSPSGVMHLSMALRGASGGYNNDLFFTAHYNQDGKLEEVSSPQPVQFAGEGKDAVGYIEHKGEIYTLPVTRSQYEKMMQEVALNQGHGMNMSQDKPLIHANAQDVAATVTQSQQHTQQQQQSASAPVSLSGVSGATATVVTQPLGDGSGLDHKHVDTHTPQEPTSNVPPPPPPPKVTNNPKPPPPPPNVDKDQNKNKAPNADSMRQVFTQQFQQHPILQQLKDLEGNALTERTNKAIEAFKGLHTAADQQKFIQDIVNPPRDSGERLSKNTRTYILKELHKQANLAPEAKKLIEKHAEIPYQGPTHKPNKPVLGIGSR